MDIIGVVTMNSERQVIGKLGHVVQIHVCRLPQVTLNLSNGGYMVT